MNKILLPENGNYYKANLHAHTTVTDGNLSPQALAQAYYEHGYQVLAITDHEILVDHSDLNRPDFLTLTSYEVQFKKPTAVKLHGKVCHLNLYARDPHNVKQVWHNPVYCTLVKPVSLISEIQYVGGCDRERVYDMTEINAFIREAKENGFIVCYNHPTWSLAENEDYVNLEGLFAMEIFNTDCAVNGRFEYNAGVYDAMLRHGQRLACAATDDCHNDYPLDDPLSDSFGGFCMISAPELSYDAVIAALEHGDFYASCGPLIKSLRVEDGTVYIRTSEARAITMTTFGRRAAAVRASRGETVFEAAFPLDPEDVYFRVEVMDREGQRANSRAYFLDEIGML